MFFSFHGYNLNTFKHKYTRKLSCTHSHTCTHTHIQTQIGYIFHHEEFRACFRKNKKQGWGRSKHVLSYCPYSSSEMSTISHPKVLVFFILGTFHDCYIEEKVSKIYQSGLQLWNFLYCDPNSKCTSWQSYKFYFIFLMILVTYHLYFHHSLTDHVFEHVLFQVPYWIAWRERKAVGPENMRVLARAQDTFWNFFIAHNQDLSNFGLGHQAKPFIFSKRLEISWNNKTDAPGTHSVYPEVTSPATEMQTEICKGVVLSDKFIPK